MKVLEDQVTRNTGRKQSPCLNQNILARILLRGASRETRTHEKKQRRATMKRTFLKAAPGSGAESAEVLYRQSHGGVSQDDLWQHTVYSYLFPKTRPVGRATQMKPSSVPLKTHFVSFCWKIQLPRRLTGWATGGVVVISFTVAWVEIPQKAVRVVPVYTENKTFDRKSAHQLWIITCQVILCSINTCWCYYYYYHIINTACWPSWADVKTAL